VRHILFSMLMVHASLASVTTMANASGPIRRAASTTSEEVQAVQGFAKAFPHKKIKVSDLIKKLEGQVPANYIEMMREKAKPVMNETLEFEALSGNKVVFKAQGNEAVVEVLNLEEGKFKVNNKTATLDFRLKPEFLWSDVDSLFKKQDARHPLMILFLPEAEAFWGWVLGIGVVGLGLYMYNRSNCEKYRQYANSCTIAMNTTSNVGLVDLYNNILKHDSSWLNLSMGCSSEKASVRMCMSTLKSRLEGTAPAADVPGLIRGTR